MAAQTNDIATIIRLMSATSALTPTDFIKKTVGSFLFMYYMYVEKMHVRPVDLDDWVDGLLYLDASAYLQKRAHEETMARMRKERGK